MGMHPLSVDSAMAEFLKSEVFEIKEEDNEPPLAGAVAKAPPAKPGFGGGGVFAGLPTPAFPASSSGASGIVDVEPAAFPPSAPGGATPKAPGGATPKAVGAAPGAAVDAALAAAEKELQQLMASA